MNDNIAKAEQLLTDYTKETTDNDTKANVKLPKQRVRCFSLSSYIDTDSILTFLKRADWIHHWAVAYHDKDVKKDGTRKEPHTHVLIYTFCGKTCSSILRHFDRLAFALSNDNPQSTLIEIPTSMEVMYRYLLHLDDPEKFQYDPSVRITDDMMYWSKMEKTDEMTASKNYGLSMVNDLLDGVNYRTMCERYGKDFIYHAKYVEDMASKIAIQENSLAKESICDANLFRPILLQEYTPYDVNKFMTMLKYLTDSISIDYYDGKVVELYLKGEKNE